MSRLRIARNLTNQLNETTITAERYDRIINN